MSGVVREEEGSTSSRRCKRLKSPAAAESDGVDRISELPEALIVDILSLLPTRDSIRTGALARKWQHLWTRVPHLYFDDGFSDTFRKDRSFRPGEFVANVNKTLSLFHGGSKVKSFRVKWCYCYGYQDDSHFDLWTQFAVENGIEKFELENYVLGGTAEYYSLPQLLFTNSSFTELRFCYCDFPDVRGPVSWNSLKKLTISDPDFTDESLEQIVAGAPALEILDLVLRGIPKFHFGNLVSLKKLTVTIEYWTLDDDEVAEFEILAPSVQSLEVSGCFGSCKLLDMTSLLEATIFGVHHEERDQYPILTQEVLHSLLNVQTLTLGTWVIQGLAKLPVNNRPSLSKCKCLTIDTYLWKEDPSAIASLLTNTPGIETLIVTMFGHDRKYKDTFWVHGSSYVDQYWSSQEMASNYLTHLTTVTFYGFWAYRTFAFPFVQFLLKNARGLQKVIINLETKDIIHQIALTELFETSQKLLSFPRSSPDAKLLINL